MCELQMLEETRSSLPPSKCLLSVVDLATGLIAAGNAANDNVTSV